MTLDSYCYGQDIRTLELVESACLIDKDGFLFIGPRETQEMMALCVLSASV